MNERESYEIDIYYEFLQAGVKHRVAVECKDWKKPADQGQVLLFHQKIKNIGDEIVGVFVSQKGYQSGAMEVAKRHGILALTGADLPTLPRVNTDFLLDPIVEVKQPTIMDKFKTAMDSFRFKSH